MGKKSRVTEAVVEAADKGNGKKTLPCTKAFRLARLFAVDLCEIGRICNEQKIKIVNCQLGCFK